MNKLPDELLMHLASYLDTNSMIHLCSVSDRWRRVINSPGVFNIKEGIRTSNVVFRSPIFKNELVHNVRELNLTSVTDMDEECAELITAMTNLKKANFSFSNIPLQAIVKYIPESVKDITLTLTARDYNLNGNFSITTNMILFFAQFETMNLKFLSSFGVLESKMLTHFIFQLKCPCVKLTYLYRIVSEYPILEFLIGKPRFKQLTLKCAYENYARVISCNWKSVEFLLWNIDLIDDTFKIVVSPKVNHILFNYQSDIKINNDLIQVIDGINELQLMLFKGQIMLLMWNSAQIENVSEEIYKTIKHYLFSYFCVHGVANAMLVNTENDILALYHLNNSNKMDQAVWDFDTYVHTGIKKLSISGKCICNLHSKIDLRTSGIRKVLPVGKIWNNLTFLHIHQIDLDNEFWSLLFQKTEKLETLTVTVFGNHPTTNYIGISQNINKCKTLKNFKIVEGLNIHAKVLFKGLSKCPKLEVINVNTTNNFEYILNTFDNAYKDENIKAREVVQLQSEIIKMIQFCTKLDTMVFVNLLNGDDKVMIPVRKTISTAALIYNTNLTLLFYNRSPNTPNKCSIKEKMYLFYPNDIFYN